MSGIFEELEMFDEGDKVATRQAIAVANKRFNDKFAGFLRQASSKKEFESRLALVDTDISNMVADVTNEYGGDAEKLAAAINETVKISFNSTPLVEEACSNCGDHGCADCTGDPEAAKTAKDDRPEHLKAQDEIQKTDEHSQVPPWLKKQDEDEDQEDGGNRKSNIESQPVANPVPLAERPGYTAGGEDIDAALEQAPSAVGTGKEAAAHKVEKKDDKFYVTEKGEGEVAGPFDSKDEAESRADKLNGLENLETEKTHTAAMLKALQLKEAAKPETGDKTEERESLPKGDEDAHDGPSPKIDKKKWVPNATNPDGNLEPIDTEGENSPVPTRQMDIKQKPDYENDDPWEHDNKVWEREQLPSADDNAGFDGTRNIDQPTKAAETFPDKGQTNPVTREALSAMDRTASFRVFLNDIGMSHADFRNASDEQKSRLWDIYNNYDMPKYTEEEGLNVPLTEEAPEGMEEAPLDAPVEDIFADNTPVEVEEEIGLNGEIDELPIEEEVIIEETPEDVESIIEREDDEGDRVTVVDEGDEDIDLNIDEDLEEFAEIDPSEFSEGPSEEELEDLIRNIEENPDDFQ